VRAGESLRKWGSSLALAGPPRGKKASRRNRSGRADLCQGLYVLVVRGPIDGLRLLGVLEANSISLILLCLAMRVPGRTAARMDLDDRDPRSEVRICVGLRFAPALDLRSPQWSLLRIRRLWSDDRRKWCFRD
jgi:hypothetical protein